MPASIGYGREGDRAQIFVATLGASKYSFAGTVFKNAMDWRADLHWFTPGHIDEYTLTQVEFAKAFAEQCAKRSKLGRPISGPPLFHRPFARRWLGSAVCLRAAG